MRRLAPEWLLAPVFVLPLAAAAATALVVRQSHAALLDAWRKDGAASAARWIASDPDGAAAVVLRFSRSLARPAATDDGWVPFRHPAASGFVRAHAARSPQTTWDLAADFPGGLRPAGLADAAVRLTVEAGHPPATSPAADAGTVAFAALLATPDETRLRAAPLPAATKLYLRRKTSAAGADEDATVLAALRALDAAVADARPRVVPGAHVVDGVTVLVPPDAGPVLVYPDARDVPDFGPLSLVRDEARLVWSARGVGNRDDVLWRGCLDAPLAGEWAIVAEGGGDWWRTPAFGRTVLPVLLVCAAFLFVPTALLVSIRRRRRLDEARARFINELAHDLRTPVTSLRLHAEMLAAGRVPLGQESRYLDTVGREAARLSSLLANLLDLSRLDRGAREFERRPVDVMETLGAAVGDFVAQYPKRADDVTVDVASGLVASTDRTALARCVANLLDNAGKFTDAGIAIRVSAARAEGGGVRIVVADDGPGVAPADRARVFELYERGAGAAERGAPGTGIGLAVVRDLATGMGGRVSLIDAPSGAAFELLLPEATDG